MLHYCEFKNIKVLEFPRCDWWGDIIIHERDGGLNSIIKWLQQRKLSLIMKFRIP